jgi:cobalt/nickel transport system ATP-binding protein
MDLAYELCSRVLVMDHGRVFAEGPCHTVLGDPALLKAHRLEQPLSMMIKKQSPATGGRPAVYGEGKGPN